MVGRREIVNIAKEFNVPPNTIDKDYVLGHFLNQLFSFDWAKSNMVFKGGTCLRKCFFKDYRFSEDIDITVLNPEFNLTKSHIEEVCQKMNTENDIPTNILKFEKISHQNIEVGWDAEICYWGANHNPSESPVFRTECHTKIILEIRNYELFLFPSNERDIIHNYSDKNTVSNKIRCYDIHEILSEKLRAILQRNRGEARDYFDIWYIKNNSTNVNWSAVKDAFLGKCNFKNIVFKSTDQFFIEERLKQVEITYKARLNHQLPFEADIKLILEELKLFLPSIFMNR